MHEVSMSPVSGPLWLWRVQRSDDDVPTPT